MSYGSTRNLSAKWRWAERAAAWDADQARAAAEKLSAARRQMAEDHARIARAMIAKAAAAVLAIDAESLSPAEAARWLDIASKVQRTALGEPERTLAVTGPAGGAVRLESVPTTEAERIAALRASAQRIAELAGAADEQLAAADPAAFALPEAG
jgi:hypothetical protein